MSKQRVLGNHVWIVEETRKAKCAAEHLDAIKSIEMGTKDVRNINSNGPRPLENAWIKCDKIRAAAVKK